MRRRLMVTEPLMPDKCQPVADPQAGSLFKGLFFKGALGKGLCLLLVGRKEQLSQRGITACINKREEQCKKKEKKTHIFLVCKNVYV